MVKNKTFGACPLGQSGVLSDETTHIAVMTQYKTSDLGDMEMLSHSLPTHSNSNLSFMIW